MLQFHNLVALLVAILMGFFDSNPALGQAIDGQSNYVEIDCYVRGVSRQVRCYSFDRPLYDGSSESITLRGIIVPSSAVVPEPDPLVILAGGPGQAASDMVLSMNRHFRRVNDNRDIIYFDIRGTGMSAPLSCEEYETDINIEPLTYILLDESIDQLQACYEANQEVIRGFSTSTAVADLDALRQHLGVEQLNLWGGSYGTRFAQYYLIEHQDNVRSAILDGVVPFEPSYLVLQAENFNASLERLVSDCAGDTDCARAFPNFDPVALLDQIGDAREIAYVHPVTGKPIETTTDRATIAQTIALALYGPVRRTYIPYALTQAVEHDNWGPLAVMGDDPGRYLDIQAIYIGAFLSITCSEEARNIPRMSGVADDPFLHGDSKSLINRSCSIWSMPSKNLPEMADGSISVPTIMLSGGADPITPPRMAEFAATAFSDVQHVIIQNGGHINSVRSCIENYLSDFISDPDDDELEHQCLGDGHRPAFLLSPTGSRFWRESE